MTVDQFRSLAIEMIGDLEKAYGSQYTDNGVVFDMKEYRNLVIRTTIEAKNEKIENYFREKSTGNLVKELVDAVNFFPKEEAVYYYAGAWEEKYRKGQIADLKVMIHHEFVPYFTKEPDRDHKYSKKLRDIYAKKPTFANLKPGLYEIMHFKDPMFSMYNEYYLMYVSYEPNTGILTLVHVEDPREDIWCLDCYLLPPFTFKINSKNSAISRIDRKVEFISRKLLGQSSEGFEDYEGHPFIEVLANDSLGLGFMDSSFRGSLGEWRKQNTDLSRLIVMTRLGELKNVTWQKEKKIPIVGFRYTTQEKNCEKVQSRMLSELLSICKSYGQSLFPEIDESHCTSNKVNFVDVKPLGQKKIMDKFHCALVGQLYPRLTQVPSKLQQSYLSTLQIWQYYLQLHHPYSL